MLTPQELLDFLIRRRNIIDYPVNFVETECAKDAIIKKLPDIIYSLRELIKNQKCKDCGNHHHHYCSEVR